MKRRLRIFAAVGLLLAPRWVCGAEPSNPPPALAPWPPERHLRLPINLEAEGRLLSVEPRPQLPLLTIGSPPEGYKTYNTFTPDFISPSKTARPYFAHDYDENRVRDIALGKMQFSGARVGWPTAVMLATPPVDFRDWWMPADISLSGNTITLKILMWDGAKTPPQTIGGSRNQLFLFDLGFLPAGDYNFILSCQHLQQAEPPLGALPFGPYQRTGRSDTASLAFTVGPKPGEPPAALPQSALSSKNAEIARTEWSERPPNSWLFQRNSVLKPEPPVLQVGAFDAAKYVDGIYTIDQPRDFPPPVPTAPIAPGQSVCAIVTGPVLDSYDWLTLESIAYRPGECRLTVGIWRSEGMRWSNRPYVPFLIVPLQLGPGDTAVSLVWRNYRGGIGNGIQPYAFETEAPEPSLPVRVKVGVK